jgi:hypothetical protein
MASEPCKSEGADGSHDATDGPSTSDLPQRPSSAKEASQQTNEPTSPAAAGTIESPKPRPSTSRRHLGIDQADPSTRTTFQRTSLSPRRYPMPTISDLPIDMTLFVSTESTKSIIETGHSWFAKNKIDIDTYRIARTSMVDTTGLDGSTSAQPEYQHLSNAREAENFLDVGIFSLSSSLTIYQTQLLKFKCYRGSIWKRSFS